MMQNINKFAFSTLARRKSLSIPGPQRPDVCVSVFPREPPVFTAVASVDVGLIHWSPPWRFAFWVFCDSSVTVLCSQQYPRLSHR